MRLDGKVAIVTGASEGIGAAVAQGLQQRGALFRWWPGQKISCATSVVTMPWSPPEICWILLPAPRPFKEQSIDSAASTC